MNSLDPRVEKSLRDAHDALALRGDLLSVDRMRASYAAFRSRFGPDVLKSLDGPALLNAMHSHGNKESLVYGWSSRTMTSSPVQRLGASPGGARINLDYFGVRIRHSGWLDLPKAKRTSPKRMQ